MSDLHKIWYGKSNAEHNVCNVMKNQKSWKSKMAAGRHFSRRSASGHNQTRGPIWTSDTSKHAFRAKEVPFGV
jgi:hypothetical protein